MSYIGNTPTTQSFISGTDYFNGTGAQTAFTLSRTVASVNDIQAVVNNVVQVPNDAYTISGTTITFTSAPSAGTNNVYVRYLSTTTQAITPSQNTVSWNTLDANTQQDLGISFKNRIINGNMVIDQRNAGAAVTINSAGPTYTVDRWKTYNNTDAVYTVQQDSSAPAGFTNSVKLTVTTADSSLSAAQNAWYTQAIEGYNIADLNFGSSNAKTVTMSFWVKSSLTGTFNASILNSATDRVYLSTYTINAANTWEQKTITIPGDQSGTWLTTNGVGMYVFFNLASGSNYVGTINTWNTSYVQATSGTSQVLSTLNATWAITGVQLEVGTQATTFTTAGGSYGAELALCQRYYEKSYSIDTVPGTNTSVGQYLERATAQAGGFSGSNILYVVQKRAAPTATFYRADGTVGSWNYNRSGTSGTASVALADAGTYQGRLNMDTGSAWAATEIFGHYTLSAEL